MNILHWLGLALYQRVISLLSNRVIIALLFLLAAFLAVGKSNVSPNLPLVGCAAICEMQWQNIPSWSHSLTQQDTDLTAIEQNETSNACCKECVDLSDQIGLTELSGSLNSKNVEPCTFIFSLPIDFQKIGSHQSGMKSSDQKTSAIYTQEQGSKKLNQEEKGFVLMLQNMRQNRSRRSYLKISAGPGVSGAPLGIEAQRQLTYWSGRHLGTVLGS